MTRLAVHVRGVVQGVGFRPFVFHAARRHGLGGFVGNVPDGVRIEVEGDAEALARFVDAIAHAPPPPARVDAVEVAELAGRGETAFRIVASGGDGAVRASLPADLATCADCHAEVLGEGRRRDYPFTSCARCGPRFTLVEDAPWDRARTAMRRFPMCAACAREHDDPEDRRFHAQPIACPACGPRLVLVGGDAWRRAQGGAALDAAADLVRTGGLLALKGLGGYQLVADACDEAAVARLRSRKRREAKPFAVMFADAAQLGAHARATAAELAALRSAEAPIVLVARAPASTLAAAVAPGRPDVGAMLPYTPLHALLLRRVGRPVVCTSGNLTDEPICTDDDEARERLRDVADAFLAHDRPVVRPVDDSVARVGPRGLELLRRARGFVPRPLPLGEPAPVALALGGQLKATVALHAGGEVILSQHLGDLHGAGAAALLERTAWDLLRFYGARPEVIACDLHPDYASTRLAERLAGALGLPVERVQHHHAHVLAACAEHGLRGPVLGFAWDGAGLGDDGTLWGGEVLACEGAGFARVAHLRPFRLPGGERAMREPRRAALGLLHAVDPALAAAHAARWFRPDEAQPLLRMLARGVSAPVTTSMGRLFDGVAALTGLVTVSAYEGQAAMDLEAAAARHGEAAPYPLPLEDDIIDWAPLVRAVLDERDAGRAAARFHAALLRLVEALAARAPRTPLVFSGGCFQNRLLRDGVHARLGVRAFSPAAVPPGDGGLSLGQVLAVARRWKEAGRVPGHPR